MAQSYYTLEQAAGVLGISQDVLKKMAQSKELRAFADGRSFKFRLEDIEELKRKNQFGSDPDIRLTDPFADDDDSVTLVGMQPESANSDTEIKMVLSGQGAGSDPTIKLVPDEPSGRRSDESGINLSDDAIMPPSDADLVLAFDDEMPTSSSAKKPADLEATSDVNFSLFDSDPDLPMVGEGSKVKMNKDLDATIAMPSGFGKKSNLEDTDALNFDLLDGDDSVGLPTKKGSNDSSLNLAGTAMDSSITLDDDSDFKIAADTSFKLADDSDFAINLQDSSVNIPISKSKGPAPDITDATIDLAASDFELDADSSLNIGKDSGVRLGGNLDDADSEFELNLDSSEDLSSSTDAMPGFSDSDDDIPAKKPAKSKVAAAAAPSDSDFELAIDEDEADESGSEVVAIDEDSEEADEDEDEEYDDEEFSDDVAPAAGAAAAAAAAARLAARNAGASSQPAPWPAWIAPVLFINTIALAVVGMMMWEIMRNTWSYHGNNLPMSGTIVSSVSNMAKSLFGDKK